MVHHFCPNRETNLKVRQALTVTSDMGDITKLMEFDGEMIEASGSLHVNLRMIVD